MPRIRTIKPEFFRHEELQDLEAENPGSYCMLVFVGLWTQSDNQGIFLCKPRQLKLDILPFLDFDMEKTIDLLENSGFLSRYSVNGKPYGIIETFPEHQRFTGKEAGEAGKKHPLPEENIQGSNGETEGKQQGSNGERQESQEREREREKEREWIGKNSPHTPEKSKSKKKKTEFVPPSREEFIKYFTDNGYSKESGWKSFDYYANGNPPWHDGHGNPVKSWKQKAIAVWFKDENKDLSTKSKPIDREKALEEYRHYQTPDLKLLAGDGNTWAFEVLKERGEALPNQKKETVNAE